MKITKILAFTLVASCTAGEETSHTTSIIGESNDLTIISNDETRAKHGLIETGEKLCNAFLEAENLVTTALHCIGEDADQFIGYTFKNLQGVESDLVEVVYLDPKKDLVTYMVDYNYPSYYKKELAMNLNAKLELRAIVDETLYSTFCPIVKAEPDFAVVRHTCDSSPGFSGSPMIQDGKVTGVHLGSQLVDNDYNYAIDFAFLSSEEADITGLEDFRGEFGRRLRIHRAPRISIPNPLDAVNDAVKNKANELANSAKSQNRDYDDCVIIVTAGLAAWGSSMGGPYGAAIGGAAGVAASRMACRRAFGHE